MTRKLGAAKLIVLLFASIALFCEAQNKTIYKVVAEDGTVTYTDIPPTSSSASIFEAEKNTANQSAPLSSGSVPIAPIQGTEADYPPLEIVSPAPEATIRNNQGDVSIRVKPLQILSTHIFALIFNGENVQENTTGLFNLTGVDRGAHTYSVILMDNKGKTLASTPIQTLFLHQASVLINNN